MRNNTTSSRVPSGSKIGKNWKASPRMDIPLPYRPRPHSPLRKAYTDNSAPLPCDRILQYHSARQENRRHARTLAREVGNSRSLSPLRETSVFDSAGGSDLPKSRASSVPIDEIRKALVMTKINDVPASASTTSSAMTSRTKPRSSGPRTRERAKSDPNRYGAFEVVTRDKYHVP